MLSNRPFPEPDEWNKNIWCPGIQQKQVGTVTSRLTNTPLTWCYGHRLFQPGSSSRCSPVSVLTAYHSHPCRVGCGEERMRGGNLEGSKPKYTKDSVSLTSIKMCRNGILISPVGSTPKVFRTPARKSRGWETQAFGTSPILLHKSSPPDTGGAAICSPCLPKSITLE